MMADLCDQLIIDIQSICDQLIIDIVCLFDGWSMWSTDHRHCIVCLWSVDHIEVYDQLVCLWSVDHIDQPSSNPFLPTAMQPGEFWLHASACRELHPLNKVKESHVSYQQSRQMHVPRTLQVALLLEERGWMMAPCSPLLASTCVRRFLNVV